MKLSLMIISVTIINEAASVNLYKEQKDKNVKLHCETPDFTMTIIFEKDGSNKGACLNGPGGVCNTGILGYNTPTQLGTTTTMEISQCNDTRDEGNWICTYGGAPSNTLPLKCSSVHDFQDCDDWPPIVAVLLTNISIFAVIAIASWVVLPPFLTTYDIFIYTLDINAKFKDNFEWMSVCLILGDTKVETGIIFLEKNDKFVFKENSIFRFKMKDIHLEIVEKLQISYLQKRNERLCHIGKIDIFERGEPFHSIFQFDCWLSGLEDLKGEDSQKEEIKNMKKSQLRSKADNSKVDYAKVGHTIVKILVCEAIALVISQLIILLPMYYHHCNFSLDIVLPITILLLTVFPYCVHVTIMYFMNEWKFTKKCHYQTVEEWTSKSIENWRSALSR